MQGLLLQKWQVVQDKLQHYKRRQKAANGAFSTTWYLAF